MASSSRRLRPPQVPAFRPSDAVRALLAFTIAMAALLPSQPALSATWTAQTSGTLVHLSDVQFLDTRTGWVTGWSGTILHTTDGGATWIPQTSGVTNDLVAIHMVNARTGWIVGRDGTVLKTSNGGAAWTRQSSGTARWLHGVLFLDEMTGWINGELGTILKTTDGGETWVQQPTHTTNTLVTLFFLDANRGWAVGQNQTVLSTIDGGATWTRLNSGSFYVLEDVYFANENNGWTVGRSGITQTTADGGRTWKIRFLPNSWLKGLEFIGPTSAFALGENGAIFFTKDAGAHWTSETSGVTADLWKSSFPRPYTGWAVGGAGTILAATGPPPVEVTVRALPQALNTSSQGNLVKILLTLPPPYRTTDLVPGTVHLNGVAPIRELVVSGAKDPEAIEERVASVDPLAAETAVGHISELDESLLLEFPRDEVIRSLEPGATSDVTVSGWLGTDYFEGTDRIRLTSPHRSTTSPETLPATELSGVGPNPVRSQVSIAFALEATTSARLHVFDATGRHVRTLLEQTLPAGRHEITWDVRDSNGQKVAAGVYFFRLTTGGKTQSQKVTVLDP